MAETTRPKNLFIGIRPEKPAVKDFATAISFRELYKGLQKSQRNVLWKDSVAGYSLNGLKNTYYLRKSLLNGKYQISAYQRFTVHEPKDRDILATRIIDRQFQRSLCDNILYPEITKRFIRDNCACQQGRGVDDALDRMELHLRRYYQENGSNVGWVLQCDIKKYFPSTQHNVAIAKVRKAIRDPEAAAHACAIVESFCEPVLEDKLKELVPGIDPDTAIRVAHNIAVEREKIVREKILHPDDFSLVENAAKSKIQSIIQGIHGISQEVKEEYCDFATDENFRGIGLGSQVSQLVELLMLDKMDHFIKEGLRIRHYIRYMDDFLLIHPDKEFLKYCLAEITKKVEAIGLQLNEKTEIYPISRGVKFLKWRFILTDTGKVVRKMSDASITKERRKLRKLKAKIDAGEGTIEDARDSIKSWMANADRGDTKGIVWEMKKYYTSLFGEKAPEIKKRRKKRRNNNESQNGRKHEGIPDAGSIRSGEIGYAGRETGCPC